MTNNVRLGRKFLLAAVAAVALDASADVYWRWTSNGADANPTWIEVESPVFAPPEFTGATVEDNIVEFVQDCTYGQSGGYAVGCSMTMRSKADAGIRTLTNTAAEKGSVLALAANMALVVSNLTVHGGVTWKNPGTLSDTSVATGSVQSRGFCEFTSTGCSFELGEGGTLKNFCPNMSKGMFGVVCPTSGKGAGVVCLQPGSLITDCRGAAHIVDLGNSTHITLYMNGGEISRCYSETGWTPAGIVSAYQGGKNNCHAYFHGGRIVNNETSVNGAVVNGVSHFSGSIVVKDNVCQGKTANVIGDSSVGNNSVQQDGDFDAGAWVGVSRPATPSAGAQFGVAAAAGFSGAEHFFADADPNGLCGATNGTKLVWEKLVLKDLVYAEPGDYDGIADGAPHSIDDIVVTEPASGAVVTYSTEKTGAYSGTKPEFSVPGEYQVWYKIEATGYKPASGGLLVVIYDHEVTEPALRFSTDGGATWHLRESTEFSMPAFAGGALADNIVELMRDCSITNGTTLSCPATLRSHPDVERCTLTRVSVGGVASDAAILATADIVVSNLVVTGGARWTVPDNFASGAQDGKDGGIGFLAVNVGCTATFGAGLELRSFVLRLPASLVNVGGTLIVEEGVLVTDCRGKTPLFRLTDSNLGVVILNGGTITRCGLYKDYMGSGVVDAYQNHSGTVYVHGGTVTNNACALGFCGHTTGTAPIYISGNPVIAGNFCSDDKAKPANMYLTAASQLVQDGDLGDAAKVRVTLGGDLKAECGEAFGTADGEWTGAAAFRADGSVCLGMRKADGSLAWTKRGLMLIVR